MTIHGAVAGAAAGRRREASAVADPSRVVRAPRSGRCVIVMPAPDRRGVLGPASPPAARSSLAIAS
jgi:hypothetical protein